MDETPETWLRPQLNLVLTGCSSICEDRVDKKGGGCTTFIKEGLAFRIMHNHIHL